MPRGDGPAKAARHTRPRDSGHVQRAEVAGRVIEVRGAPDSGEQLWIDGEQRQFFVTSAGYHLLDDAYRPAEKTLFAAAKKHVERLAKPIARERK